MSWNTLKKLSALLVLCLLCYANAAWLRPVRDIAYSMHWIENSYVEPKSTANLRDAALQGLLESLDPYSAYIPSSALTGFNALFDQQFAGLGIQVEGPPQRPKPTIVATIFHSPAFRAGLRPGDVIREVDGNKVEEAKTMETLSRWLQGPVGSTAAILIDRAGEPMSFNVPREFVAVESITGDRRKPDGTWEHQLQVAPDILYLHIELFGERTAAELRELLSKATSCKGLIIDLRDNSGGLLDAAVEVCDMFLEDGPIVSTNGRENNAQTDTAYASAGTLLPTSTPICILINRESASASEVVAACLKDRKRAIVVGERSYGKGNVQSIVPVLGGSAAIRLTTAYYFPPSGRRIHKRPNDSPDDEWGVLPDTQGLVGLSQEDEVASQKRFQTRSDPLRNGLITDHPLAQVEDPNDSQFELDKPLARAVELLRSQVPTP